MFWNAEKTEYSKQNIESTAVLEFRSVSLQVQRPKIQKIKYLLVIFLASTRGSENWVLGSVQVGLSHSRKEQEEIKPKKAIPPSSQASHIKKGEKGKEKRA